MENLKETLAKAIHEGGRRPCREGKLGDPNFPFFPEWEDVPERVREARRMQAIFLMTQFHITKKEEPCPPTSAAKRET